MPRIDTNPTMHRTFIKGSSPANAVVICLCIVKFWSKVFYSCMPLLTRTKLFFGVWTFRSDTISNLPTKVFLRVVLLLGWLPSRLTINPYNFSRLALVFFVKCWDLDLDQSKIKQTAFAVVTMAKVAYNVH